MEQKKTLLEQYNELAEKDMQGEIVIVEAGVFSIDDFKSTEELHSTMNNFIEAHDKSENATLLLSDNPGSRFNDQYIVVVIAKQKIKNKII